MASQVSFQQSMMIENVWANALEQLRQGCSEIMFRSDIRQSIGSHGLAVITDRFSSFKGFQISLLEDENAQIIRFVPLEEPVAIRPTNRAKVAKERMSKVPRPPNSFMLYRKAQHEAVTSENPGLHNNQISKIIGKMWNTEAEEVRASYKAQAEVIKRKHQENYPDYQYQPRKPSEKRKRTTKKQARRSVNAENEALDYAVSTTSTSTEQLFQGDEPNLADLEFFEATEFNELIGNYPHAVRAFQVEAQGHHLVHDVTGMSDDALELDEMVDTRNAAPHLQNEPFCSATIHDSYESHTQRLAESADIDWMWFETEMAKQKEADNAHILAALLADQAIDKGPVDQCCPAVAGPWYHANMRHSRNEDRRQTELAGLPTDPGAEQAALDEPLDMSFFTGARLSTNHGTAEPNMTFIDRAL